ncbi:hypothetical protein QMK19_37035 [Streptomyces sp. H10-C2]|uniref:hypothetical protein n=1 Tax=unclassified Streptomyces TaxID=2593676 RepID=UPI0024B882BF|nr:MULTISPECIES: hypothetical protein [unclassified Streptomyces]MDJ0347331.1 hypothetical protein [Streptomyces sp. PH10-H1]MDJ0375070.1 hypothetical protein [Streptomyces sp. H10-C2]
MGLLVLLTAPMLLALILVWNNPPQNARHRSSDREPAASPTRHGHRRTTHA